jgi:hypothetical protein
MSSFNDPINNIDYTVNMIKRDIDNYNCSLRYYEPDGKSSYDIIIARHTEDKLNSYKIIKKHEIIIEELDDNINRALLPITDKNYKKASSIQITKWKEQYSDTYEIISNNKENIEQLEEIIHNLSWKRRLEIYRSNKLWNLRCEYILDRDSDKLKNGVMNLNNYIEKEKIM